MTDEQLFNFDLPIRDDDLARRQELHPDIAWVLMDDTLRRKFAGDGKTGASGGASGYDTIANAAKRRARRLGVVAILAGIAALSLAAMEPLYTTVPCWGRTPSKPWVRLRPFSALAVP